MPPTVTFSPDNPRPVLDGINIYVTGEVNAPGRIVIYRNSDDKLIGQSPAQGQDAPLQDAQVEITLTGNPTGGTWALNIDYQYGDADVTGIPWDATEAQIQTLVDEALRGGAFEHQHVARVSGAAPGPIVLVLEGEYAGREVEVTGSDSLTGGTSPAVDIDTVAVGGKDPAGTTQLWLPALLLPEGVYDVDLVYAGGDDDGASMLDDMVQIYVEE